MIPTLPFLLLLLISTVCLPMTNDNNNNDTIDKQDATKRLPDLNVENQTYYITVISEDENEEIAFQSSENAPHNPIFAIKTHALPAIYVLAGGVVIIESHVPLPSFKAHVFGDGKLEIRSTATIHGPVELTVEDSGEVKIADLHSTLIKVTVLGNGKLFSVGQCERQEIIATDNALVDHAHLLGNCCNIEQRGLAHVTVNISDFVSACIDDDLLVINLGSKKIFFMRKYLGTCYTKD